MLKYTLVDQRVFPKQGEAEKWIKEEKMKRGAAGSKYKIETNYLEGTNQWEGLIFMKMEEE